MSRIDVDRIEVCSHSDVGRVRSVNQDRCDEFADRRRRLLVVADGMGGHAGGEHASRIAVETIGSVFEADSSESGELLCRGFAEANANILSESLRNSALGDRTFKLGSGTTSEYGRYIKSLGEPCRGAGPRRPGRGGTPSRTCHCFGRRLIPGGPDPFFRARYIAGVPPGESLWIAFGP